MADASLSNITNELLADAIQAVDEKHKIAKAASLRYRAEIKRWEERGVDPKALKDALKFREMPEEQFQPRMRQFLRMMHIEGYGVGPTTLFASLDLSPLGPEAKARFTEWQAYDLGYQVALNGEDRSVNALRAGSATFVAWDKGWLAGAEVMKSILPDNTEAAPTRRERTPAPAPAAAAPAPKTQAQREAEPMWDDAAQRTADKVAAEMDTINSGNGESGNGDASEDTGLNLPDPALSPPAPKRRGRPPGSGRKPKAPTERQAVN